MNATDHSETLAGLMSVQPSTVITDDGVRISVREWGPRTAPLTVIFAHDFCLQTSTWAPQLEYLRQRWGDTARLVAYDQRGHGESGVAAPLSYTIDQLGCGMQVALDAVAPDGPILLVGHSMGGMSALSHARQHPQMIGSPRSGGSFDFDVGPRTCHGRTLPHR